MKHDSAHKALSEKPSKKKGKKKVVGAHIKRAKGGYIIHHEHEDHPGEDHVVPDMAALQKHMAVHLGELEPQGETQKQETAEQE